MGQYLVGESARSNCGSRGLHELQHTVPVVVNRNRQFARVRLRGTLEADLANTDVQREEAPTCFGCFSVHGQSRHGLRSPVGLWSSLAFFGSPVHVRYSVAIVVSFLTGVDLRVVAPAESKDDGGERSCDHRSR